MQPKLSVNQVKAVARTLKEILGMRKDGPLGRLGLNPRSERKWVLIVEIHLFAIRFNYALSVKATGFSAKRLMQN